MGEKPRISSYFHSNISSQSKHFLPLRLNFDNNVQNWGLTHGDNVYILFQTNSYKFSLLEKKYFIGWFQMKFFIPCIPAWHWILCTGWKFAFLLDILHGMNMSKRDSNFHPIQNVQKGCKFSSHAICRPKGMQIFIPCNMSKRDANFHPMQYVQKGCKFSSHAVCPKGMQIFIPYKMSKRDANFHPMQYV